MCELLAQEPPHERVEGFVQRPVVESPANCPEAVSLVLGIDEGSSRQHALFYEGVGGETDGRGADLGLPIGLEVAALVLPSGAAMTTLVSTQLPHASRLPRGWDIVELDPPVSGRARRVICDELIVRTDEFEARRVHVLAAAARMSRVARLSALRPWHSR